MTLKKIKDFRDISCAFLLVFQVQVKQEAEISTTTSMNLVARSTERILAFYCFVVCRDLSGE